MQESARAETGCSPQQPATCNSLQQQPATTSNLQQQLTAAAAYSNSSLQQ